MNATQKTAAVVSLACLMGFCAPGNLRGQEGWMPVGPPTIVSHYIFSSGGITYFSHTSRLEGCRRVALGPVGVSGTNVAHLLNEEEWVGICLCNTLVCEPVLETHVSVLGALSPGGYSLVLYSSAGYPLAFLWMNFTVPEPAGNLLSANVRTNHLELSVAGVPKVQYIMERCTGWSGWTAVATNYGGPFTWSEPVAPEAVSRFYRVRVVGQ